MQKKDKSSSILSIITKAIRPRQTWNDKVIVCCFYQRIKSIFRSGPVYGRHSLDASGAGINSWLRLGHYSITRHRGTAFVSVISLLVPNGFALSPAGL